VTRLVGNGSRLKKKSVDYSNEEILSGFKDFIHRLNALK
jgi:hypothetical protein